MLLDQNEKKITMKSPGTSDLPTYDQPPVIEVVCGIQFEPLENFNATALGLFWQRVRGDYPKVEEQPPVDSVIERFEIMPVDEQRAEVLSIPPLPRLFFIHREPNWVIQVQKERLFHNWRKTQEGDTYPHFPDVFSKFWGAWQQFLTFCDDESLGIPHVNQLEVTYINHIPEGEAWRGFGELGSVFPDFSWRPNRSFLPPPESVNWKLSFPLPDRAGRLHVVLRHGIRRADSRPVLLCELTARGVPASVDDASVRSWFETGREWVVRGFADLTNDRVQKEVWRRRA